eukprot:g11722.t1
MSSGNGVLLSPREQVLAEYLRSPDTLESAQSLARNATAMQYLTSIEPTPQKDALADTQRVTCLKRILQYPEMWVQFQPVLLSLWQMCRAAHATERMQAPLELLLSLDKTEALSVLLPDELLHPQNWAWMFVDGDANHNATSSSLKSSQLCTALLCRATVIARLPVEQLSAFFGGADFRRMCEGSDEVKFRFLQLIADLIRANATVPENALVLLRDSYFTDDILLKLNAIELFQHLGASDQGRSFLLKGGLPEKIAQELNGEDASNAVTLDERVAPTCVLFLGYIVAQEPQKYFAKFFSRGPLRTWVGRFLAAPATADVAKLCLLKLFGAIGQISDEEFASAETGFTAFHPELLKFAKDSVSGKNTTNAEKSKTAIASWITITAKFPHRGVDIVDDAIYLLRPEVAALNAELRPFVYQLLANCAKDSVASLRVIQAEQVRTVLLDFASETTHDSRVEKHQFVRNLVSCTDVCENVLEEGAMGMLKVYAEKGPYMTLMGGEARVKVGEEAG